MLFSLSVCPSVIGGVSNHHCCRRCCCCCCCSCCLVIISRLSWQGQSFHSSLAYSFKLFCVSWVRVLPVCLLKRWQQRGSDWQYVQTAAVPHTHKKCFYQHSFHPTVTVPLSSPFPKMQQAPSPAPPPLN